MLKRKVSLIALTMFNLQACTAPVAVHEPVECVGLPDINIKFTEEEAYLIPDSAVDKITLMRETYKARINLQCKINLKHDKSHTTD